ncbi:MAG TPA: hypothetical protein VMA13_05545, partial [Candidatus Saccharimonadales bacterium]|nr:hypothetical protein [Candidatus Saccharimonadales bacterium]
INGQPIGQFSAAQLDQGINLAQYHTPMLLQAYDVLDLVYKEAQFRFYAWRVIQLQLAFDKDRAVQYASEKLIDTLYTRTDQIADDASSAAKPQPAHYELVRIAP